LIQISILFLCCIFSGLKTGDQDSIDIKENKDMDLFEQIVEATVAGDQDRCVSLAQEVVSQGIDAFKAIEEGYSKGMSIVGEKFEQMEYFLPQLLTCADAMKAALEVLKPHMGEDLEGRTQGIVVLGTIQGDIHDLGKNIVKTMIQASGFVVHDLGCDVPVRQFIEKAEEVGADIIAASAILTTTMAHMPDLAGLLNEMGIRGDYIIMVGGAPVTPDYATRAGADGYGENASEAVEVAKRLMMEKRKGGSQ
jgi:corrinoid protein of di/trimethylamine methyltransferase